MKGEREPTQEEIAAWERAVEEHGVATVAPVLYAFASFLTPERVHEIALDAVRQGAPLAQVLIDATSPTTRGEYPIWGLRMTAANKTVGVISTPKDMGQVESLDAALHHATLLALITSPHARSVLAAHGFSLEFFQAPAPPKIVTS